MTNISDSEEQLLMKYVDGECSFWERRKAEKLLGRSPSAQDFVGSLRSVSVLSLSVLSSQNRVSPFGDSAEVDLWDRIEQRIEQEERAAFFLGERRIKSAEENSSFSRFFSGVFQHNLVSSGVGVAVAACLAVLIWQPGILFFSPETSPDVPPGSTQVASLGDPSLVSQDVSAASVNLVSQRPTSNPALAASRLGTRMAEGVYEQPRVLDNEWNRAMEVEWMRSDGRVRMVHDSEAGGPIIWVKRRNLNSALRSRLSSDGRIGAERGNPLQSSPVPTARLIQNR